MIPLIREWKHRNDQDLQLSDKYDRDRGIGVAPGSRKDRDQALGAGSSSRIGLTAPVGGRRAEAREAGKRKGLEGAEDWRRGMFVKYISTHALTSPFSR